MIRVYLRWLVGAAAVAAVIALATVAPSLLRRVGAFHVDRVEVVGTRYLAPHDALEASGITSGSSVFDEPGPWIEALVRHPMVDTAWVRRRLPSTLIIEVREIDPVALIRTPELVPVDARARVLPIDPAALDLDLPVVGVETAVLADRRLSSPAAAAMIEALVRIRRLAPGLAARISEAAPGEAGGLRLLLRDPPTAEVLLPPEPGPVQLERLRLTIGDLVQRAELDAVHRIDVRFRDQVVVSLNSGVGG